ncbi:metal-dependent hydrolase [Candidatus Woesearchaeota archaeon]|nr:metal-dependent hydrolase [Candidatus Woesearchaeota archaeon]
MMFFSHLLFGILSGFLGCKFLGCGNEFLFAAIAAVASVIPDIDHLYSKVSRKLPPFAVVLSVFRHRGFIHSLFPPLILYFVLIKLDYLLAAATLVGYASHLVLDAATTNGIRPLYPVIKIRIAGFIRTNSFAEKVITLMLLVLAIAFAFSEILRFI